MTTRTRHLALVGLSFAVLFFLLCESLWAQDAPALDGLITYTAPAGGTLRVDGRLVGGLDVLARLASGAPLVDALASGGVTVILAAEPPGVWAHYDAAARQVTIDQSFWGADPRTVAALLGHEAVHVRDANRQQTGTQARATANSCYAEEYQAVVTELRIWQELHGPGGMTAPTHAYEREQNWELARYLQAPARYWERLGAAYGPACALPG